MQAITSSFSAAITGTPSFSPVHPLRHQTFGQSHPASNISTNCSKVVTICSQCRQDTMPPFMFRAMHLNRSKSLARCAKIPHALLNRVAQRTGATQRTHHCNVVCHTQQPLDTLHVKQQAADMGSQPGLRIVGASEAGSQSSVPASNEDPMGQVKHFPNLTTSTWGYVTNKMQAHERSRPSQTSQPTQAVKHDRLENEIAARKDQALKKRAAYEAVQAALRPCQVLALTCIQETARSTIVIMPTGSGKTRLMWHYGGGKCNVVCAPYKYLVEQLLDLLKGHGKSVEFPFVESDGSVYGILASADFIVMPFEMVPSAADLMYALKKIDRLGPMWIDEVSTS